MKKFIGTTLLVLSIITCSSLSAQPPVAAFSISPNPVCSGGILQITDLSTGNPTSWSYTVGGFGPGGQVLTSQNPTVAFNFPGTFSITLVASNATGGSQPVTQTIQVLPSPNVQIPQPLRNSCIGGNPQVLSVAGTNTTTLTYSWSTSATSSSITVQPTVTTIYSVVVTSTNGCSVLRTATVSVGSPTVLISSVPFSLCPGSTATLNASSNNPGPFSFTWSNGSSASNITTSVAAVYDVTVTNGANCTGTQSYTLGTSNTLSVNAISNPTAICFGNSALLTGFGATSYTWSTGAITNSVFVSPLVTTVYSVIGTFGNCSGTNTVSLLVSVIPTITAVASPSTICNGKNATLTASGATTYTWLPSNVGSTLAVTPSVTTTYSVRGINPGCQARTASVSVFVMQNPAVTISGSADTICPGEPIALGAGGAASYTWSIGGNSTVMIVNPFVTTTYTVTGTGANQCTAEATYTQLVDECVGLSTLDALSQEFVIYPNPSNGMVTINPGTDARLTILDITGRIVTSLEVASARSISLNLPAGLYIVQSEANGRSQAKRLLITP
jgi:PKD repeat protein